MKNAFILSLAFFGFISAVEEVVAAARACVVVSQEAVSDRPVYFLSS